MLLSIVIPVYNTAEYLEKCLNSLLSGDTSDCEILLVDDGSTDGISGELCDRLADRHRDLVRVIHQKNMGQGGARNTGVEAVCGEYVFFLDSDDAVTQEALSVIKNNILQTRADVIAFNYCTDDGAGNLTPMLANAFQTDEPFRLSERKDFLLSLPNVTSRVWRRTLFLDSGVRFPTRVKYEDLSICEKLFVLSDTIVCLPDRLYLYLQRPGSTMRSANIERNREIIDAFDDLIGWFRERGIFDAYRDELCRLCIDHLYLAASVRVATFDPKHCLLTEFRDYLTARFPDYRQNPYLSGLSRKRRLVYRLLEGKHYVLLNLLFRIHNR